MHGRKGFRFPIFWKILSACLGLAAAMLIGSYAYTKYKERDQPRRTAFFDQSLARYKAYEAGMTTSLASVADLVASQLAAPLAAGNLDEARAHAARHLDTVSGKRGVRPDLFVVFDGGGRPVFLPAKSAVAEDDLRELEPIAQARTGMASFGQLLHVDGRVFLTAVVPITAEDRDDPVGGLVLGVDVARYFDDYRRQSGSDEKRQHFIALVADNKVISSAVAPESWRDLADATRPERRVMVRDASVKVPTVKFGNAQWDYREQPAQITERGGTRDATLMVVRNRSTLERSSDLTVEVVSAIVFAVLVALGLAIWITRPLKQFIRATHDVVAGQGDLTKRFDVDCNDELGDLAVNLNKLFDDLHRLARDIQQASFQVGASSAEISAASRQMLDGAKDQAVKIEGSTAAVTELSSSIQQVASNAIEATKVAQASNDQVTAAIDSMNHIRETVEEAAEKILELGESGKRIGNIVEVIRQISEQTSLLALNASIEAAHAGEQGRGFAVVADEVSSLARRVGQSAKDIEDLIATIKDQTAAAVNAMQQGTRDVERGTERVTSTLGNLKQILSVVEDTARAVQEQAIVSDEIARNMDAVQKIAHEVLASSEEAVIQGEQLHGLAHALEESVKGFNVEESAADKADVTRKMPPGRPSAAPAPLLKAAAGGAKAHKR